LDHIDVFTINSYSDRIPEAFGEISDRLDVPIMIGEWHFGSLEAPPRGHAELRRRDRGRAR